MGIPLAQWKLAIMGSKAVRLTQKQIEHAKPKEKDYILSDGDGLALHIKSNGTFFDTNQ
ncbi:hypothetical protein HWA77_06280 [Photobacterium damselae subsp. damselae]|uniref:Integrase n=1 Tax=Photobacterium damselae subsp. damselae TaxID=85581 RepID=A0A850QJP9_PHODD|nr:hypothetical protein [Photobacterium damselae subsp. damselae]